MLSNQCKQNSLLFYDALYAIIQGCHKSGVVQLGKGRKKKVILKVGGSQGMSGNLKKDYRSLSEKVRKRLMLNGKIFNCLSPIIAIFTFCNIQVAMIFR